MQNSPHKYIKNTSTNGTILIEHLLNIGERPWTPKRTRTPPPHTHTHTHTQPTILKERRKGEKMGRDQYPWQGTEGKDRFLHSEKLIEVGKSPEAESDLWEIIREWSNQTMKDRTKPQQVQIPLAKQIPLDF